MFPNLSSFDVHVCVQLEVADCARETKPSPLFHLISLIRGSNWQLKTQKGCFKFSLLADLRRNF